MTAGGRRERPRGGESDVAMYVKDLQDEDFETAIKVSCRCLFSGRNALKWRDGSEGWGSGQARNYLVTENLHYESVSE